MTKCTLIVTTYNWPEALELVLKSIMKQSVLPGEVVIADDGSGNQTRDLIQRYKDIFPVPLKHSWQVDEGYRINSARNMAIKESDFPYIIQIDGDIILHRHFIKDHLKFAREKRLVVGRRVGVSKELTDKFTKEKKYFGLKAFRSKIVCQLHNLLLYNKFSVRGLCGCNIGFWKDDAYSVNGYDENMMSKGPNDKEFGARLVNKGVTTFNMKFYGIQFHLFHGEGKLRSNYQHLKNLYDETNETGRHWCENGLKSA